MGAQMFNDPSVGRVVDKQMRNWEIGRTQRLGDEETQRIEVQEFVTVSRTVGSGGAQVGHALGERLGWPVFDKQILDAMSQDDDIRRRLYESMDERDLSWFEETLRGLNLGKTPKNDYFHRLTETVLSLARQSRAVFIGRATDLLLPRDRGLRVRVVAPLDHRLQCYAERTGSETESARSEIERIDQDRAAFVYHHFRIEAADATRHDLILNMNVWNTDDAVALILEAMRRRGMIA